MISSAGSSGNLNVERVASSFRLLPHVKLACELGVGVFSDKFRGSFVDVEVTEKALSLTFKPALLIDLVFPMKDQHFSSAKFYFGSHRIDVGMTGAHGFGIPITGLAKRLAKKAVHEMVSGLPFEEPGYSPFSDDDLMANVAKLQQEMNHKSWTDTCLSRPADVNLEDISSPAADALLTTSEPFIFQPEPAAQLKVDEDTSLMVDLELDGRLSQAATGNLKVKIVNFTAVAEDPRVDDPYPISIGLSKVLKRLARVRSFTIEYGGKVELQYESPLASVVDSVASIGRRIGNLFRRRRKRKNNVSFVQAKIEELVLKMVRENADMIPGIDLAKALGIDEE